MTAARVIANSATTMVSRGSPAGRFSWSHLATQRPQTKLTINDPADALDNHSDALDGYTFTYGSHVLRPGLRPGQSHILAHVVQQTQPSPLGGRR